MMSTERAGATMGQLRRSPPIQRVAICVLFLQLAGCAVQQGPDAMRASWLGYNEAVQHSEQRELLLNLVRLRYTDAPEFLAISGISTQMSFQNGASIGGEFGNVEGKSSAFVSPEVFVGYSETPTITFTPRRDQEFTRQLVAPIELDSLYVLTGYGWGIDQVFRLVVRNLNGMSNDLSRESVGEGNAQLIARFANVASCLRRLEDADRVSVGVQHRREILSASIPADRVTPDSILNALEAGYRLIYQADIAEYVFTVEQPHYVLVVDKVAWDEPCLGEIGISLGLSSDREYYEIDPESARPGAENILRITTRSLLGVMAYLSHAVAVPEVHKQSGFASDSDATASVMSEILHVRVSETPIENSFLSVPYRDFWFYIAADDFASRRTLGLLTSLTRLTIGAGGAQNVPILTLPVSP